MYKNDTSALLTSLSGLTSSSHITVSNYPHTKNENLQDTSITSTYNLNGSSYPITLNPLGATNVSPTLTPLNTFITFPNRIYSYMNPVNPILINIEGPCSTAISSFSYTILPAQLSWFTFTPTSATSTQTFTVPVDPLISVSLVVY